MQSTVIWKWSLVHAIRRLSSVPVSREHRLLWGWIRLMLGFTQTMFAVAAVSLWALESFTWHVGLAALISSLAAAISRVQYAGRIDPRLEASLGSEGLGPTAPSASSSRINDERISRRDT
jgi:hypothetical protein